MRSLFCFLTAVIVLTLFSCSKSTVGPETGTGTLQIAMVDNPAVYDQVNIVVDSVQAHISTSDTTSGWVTLNHSSAAYDLLKLVNGASAVIAQATITVGRYSQIRLYIGSGSNIVVSGSTKSLITPSGSQSGVKLNVDATIKPDVTYLLTIDFDANKSIVKSGSPTAPTYHLKPVIRTVAAGTTGIIAGTVTPSSTKPTIWGYSFTDTLSTVADVSGGFKLMNLSPAAYDVYITPKDTLYRDTTLMSVSVTAGATTSLGSITLTHK